MDAISQFKIGVFEDIYLTHMAFERGAALFPFFLKSRGVDRLQKSDIVKCFDNIDHQLLISFLSYYVVNDICDLISSFLTTQIMDKNGNDYSNHMKGIPQGSPLSPVLMNIFLHQLDVKIKAFMNREMSLCYVRYADDMVFAIQSGADSEGTYEKFRRFFQKALNNLKLSATSLELFREKREAS